MVERLAQQ
ncbi:unnamed protein product, partial [Rotaria socialis]